MSSRSSIWFGLPIEGSSQPQNQPTAEQNQPVSTMPPTKQIGTINRYVKERYYQQVTRRDFLHSNQLLKYAKERQTTPHHLWLTFGVHCKKYKLDNTLGNLIEYFSLTPKNVLKEEKGNDQYMTIPNQVYPPKENEHNLTGESHAYNTSETHNTSNITYSGFINSRGIVYKKTVNDTAYYTYDIHYEEASQGYEQVAYEPPMNYYETNERVFPDSYTYEDFLLVKKEAEDEFERKCFEEETRLAESRN